MRIARLALATGLIGSPALMPAATLAEPATNLMGRVPSVEELVRALTPASSSLRGIKTGLRPADEEAEAQPSSRPAVDLEINFEFDSAALTPMARSILDNLGTALTTDLSAYGFILEGHTDAVGSDEYNLGLSQRRARAVQVYLHESYGIDTGRLTTVGKGEQELLLPEQPTAAPNRRVRVINQG